MDESSLKETPWLEALSPFAIKWLIKTERHDEAGSEAKGITFAFQAGVVIITCCLSNEWTNTGMIRKARQG